LAYEIAKSRSQQAKCALVELGHFYTRGELEAKAISRFDEAMTLVSRACVALRAGRNVRRSDHLDSAAVERKSAGRVVTSSSERHLPSTVFS
jgi:hypothetical protein